MAAEKWKKLVLGNSVKQSNDSYPPVLSSTPAAFNAPAGTASVATDAAYNPGVSYSAGDMLFYTDGKTVYDSLGNIMDGGTLNGLNGDNKSSQTAVILKSSETNYWWILTHNPANGKIYVHNVKMTGNSGRGTVAQNQSITSGGASAGFVAVSGPTTDRFNAFYSSVTSQYGFMTHLKGSNRHEAFLITGVSSHLPVFGSIVTTAIGSVYANNDAANHATIKFNGDNTKMATVVQQSVGTSGTPVTTAIVEVYDLNPATGVPSNFNSFVVPIKDAGAITPGAGNDGRLKGYDLEWDFDTSTLYVPVYDASHGLGIKWYTLNASNAVTAQGTVGKSMSSIGNNADKAIFGMYKDPYADRIYLTKPAVVGTSGGYSSDYNDTYATNSLSVIRDTSDPTNSEFTETVATTVPGDTIGKGTPTRPMAGEGTTATTSYHRLIPCDTQKEYIMDTLGSIWVLDGALDATKVADVSSISNRVNIAVQKETNFIYLLAGTGATPKIYKIDPVTGNVDAGTTVSGTGVTGFKSISSKDADPLKLYAVIEISGPHYNYAEIVISTGVATKTAGNTAHVAVDTAMIGAVLYMASGDDLYKNTGPGTWATVGANTLSKNYEGLATDDTTLYGYIEGKRYTINTSTGAATAGKSITINSSTGTWNYTAQGAGIVNVAHIDTNNALLSPHEGSVVTVANYAGCFTVWFAVSGSATVGNILSVSPDCGSCSEIESDDYCKLLVSCCDSGYKGLGFTREIVGTTDDSTCAVGDYYEITANAQSNDQLNRCVEVQSSDDSLYMVSHSNGFKVDLTTGILGDQATVGGTDITFNKHGVGFISGGPTLYYTIPANGVVPTGNATSISIPQSTTISFNYSDELITGGVVSGVTQVSRNSIDKKGVLTTVNTLTNTTVQLTGDIAVDKITGEYYCIGDSSPAATPVYNDLFKLDPSTLTHTVIADLTSTLTLSASQTVRAIEIIKDSCYVLVWDSSSFAVTLHRINKDTGSKLSVLPIIKSNGDTKFTEPPSGLGYNNPCIYWDTGAFKLASYADCSACFASATSKNCCFELVDCATGLSTITSTDVSAYLGKVIVTDTPGKCYTVYTYDNSITCTGVEVNVTKEYAECSDCTLIQTTCYRLLKCNDPTSDPKYTTHALTKMIKNKVGKTVQLEGENFCRNVDDQGNAVELISAAAQTIKTTKTSCNTCNFYLKLKQCNKPTIIRYVDYLSSTSLHPFIGHGAVKINDLGKKENEVCWEIDSTIYGPTSALRATAQLVLSGTDCTICNIQNDDSNAPQQVRLQGCCPELYPDVDFGSGALDYYTQDMSVINSVAAGNLVIWGSFTNYNGDEIDSCFISTFAPAPVSPQFLTGPVTIAGMTTDSDKCTECTDATANCIQNSNSAVQIINCDTKTPPQAVDATTLASYNDDANRIYNFSDPLLSPGCWKRCTNGDMIHGVNWYWGHGASLNWATALGFPSDGSGCAANMGLSDAQLNNNNHFTKFGSCVHSAHEGITINNKQYLRGDLMFYSDGRFVFNSNHQKMTGSVDGSQQPLLSGGVDPSGDQQYASQQCITFPKPDSMRFAGTNTYSEYYLVYQRPGTLMPLYAVISMNTADGLGAITSYDQPLPEGSTFQQSTERLIVTNRPSISDADDDYYYILDVIPWQDPGTFFGPFIPGKVRAWRVDSQGIQAPVTSMMYGSATNPGAITPQNTNISEWAKIKVNPNNTHIGISGNKNGFGWMRYMLFDEETGLATPDPSGGTGAVAADGYFPGSCSNAVTSIIWSSDWVSDFVPYTIAFEMAEKGFYIYRSGMTYPPNATDCSSYSQWDTVDGQLIPPPEYRTKDELRYFTYSSGGQPNQLDPNASGPKPDYSLPKRTLNSECPSDNCSDCAEELGMEQTTTFHKISNPATRINPVNGDNEENSLMPMLQASIVTDLHMGPDGYLYAGIVNAESTGPISNLKNWKNSFLGIGSNTKEYDYRYTTGVYNQWTPNPTGISSERIAHSEAITRFRINNQVGDFILDGSNNPCKAAEIGNANEASLYNRAVKLNGIIDFGFPQFVKRKCYASDINAISTVVTGTSESCDHSFMGIGDADFNGCIRENPAQQVFEVVNCAGGPDGCLGDGCADYGAGNAIQADGESTRFGMVEFLNQDIRDAIEALASGPQAVYMTYSFPREGSSQPNTEFSGSCDSLGSGGYSNGVWVVPKHESGPTTDNSQKWLSGTVQDKTYTVTEAQFRAEVGKAFDQVSQLFESTFSTGNGYPNNLTLRFTDLGKETGTTNSLGANDSDCPAGSWSTTAPIGFAADGASGIGDFRIWMGRHSSWCSNYTDSGCNGCNWAGAAGGYLAWASGPYLYNNTSGYDGTSGTYNQASNLAQREAGWQNIVFDVNEDWRKTTDAQASGTYEILRVGIHEILHSFGFHHAFETMALNTNCEGSTGRGTANPAYCPGCGYFGTYAGGFYCPDGGAGLYNPGCGASATCCGDPDAVMAPTAGTGSFTTDYAAGTDTAYDPNACYMSGGTPAARQDRTMACQIYGHGLPYNDSSPTFCAPYDCPTCVSSSYYSDNEDLWAYAGGGSEYDAFSWNPGTGLACWYVIPTELPAGQTVTVIPTPSDANSFLSCEACNVQFLPARWRFVLCSECPDAAQSPPQIITSQDYSEICTGINPEENDGLSPEVYQFVGYVGCYRLDCTYDPYYDYVEVPVTTLVISETYDNCDLCCNQTISQCYTITSCSDTSQSFVAIDDGILLANQYNTVTFVSLPANVLAQGFTVDDCYNIDYCGQCNETTCSPLVGPNILTIQSTHDSCYQCELTPENQDCYTLVCCDSSGDQLINVLPTADLDSAYATGQVVRIDQYPDSQGNKRCWIIQTQEICNPEISVTVDMAFVSCEFCTLTVTTQGCTDPSALNYCPQCITCVSSLGALNECCIYEGCPLSCQDPTATNYNPNNVCDCSGVEGGSDTSCCNYPSIVTPPDGIDVTYEKDCVNCLDWDTVDKVFANAAELCGHCYPPKGLTLREYRCDLTETETVTDFEQFPGGCTSQAALNYNPNAEWDDGSCVYTSGCQDVNACNFDPNAIENNPDECIYAGQCGCFDLTDSCFGCMDLTACNYNPNATIPNNAQCEYNSCYGCMDPEADNYDPNATNEDGSCSYGIEGCFANRNIYVFYDMTSMGYGMGTEFGTVGTDTKIAAASVLKAQFNAAMLLVLAEVPEFTGNIYHLCVGLSYSVNVTEPNWNPSSSADPATWNNYKIWDGTAGTTTGGAPGSTYDNARWSTSPWATETSPQTGYTNLFTAPYGTTSGGGGWWGSTTDGTFAEPVYSQQAERWLSWFQYPLHGNNEALHPSVKISFTNTYPVDKTGANSWEYYQTNNIGSTSAWLGSTSWALVSAFNSNGIDSSGNFINGLPGTQVNPFNDPPGMEGWSDTYHEFEGGDKDAICIAFIDESSIPYHQDISAICTSANFATSPGDCGAGTTNNTDASIWSAMKPSATYIFDFAFFTRAHSYGFDDLSSQPVMSVKEPNSTSTDNGWGSNNFNGIVFPTVLNGLPSDRTYSFLGMMYAAIGQGNVSESGHIPCGSFVDTPYTLSGFQEVCYSSTSNVVSFKYFTDTSRPNYYSLVTTPELPNVTHTQDMSGNTIPSGSYGYLGHSLSNYKIRFASPGGVDVDNIMQVSAEEIYTAILAGLCGTNGG